MSSAQKKAYCYASSNATWSQQEFRRAYRSNAERLEQLVLAAIQTFLVDRQRLRLALKTLGLFGSELDRVVIRGADAAKHLAATAREKLEGTFAALVERIEIGEECLMISLRSIELQRFLQWNGMDAFHGRPADWPCSSARYELHVPVCAISAERWPVVNVEPRKVGTTPRPDRKLVDLLQRARKALHLLETRRDETLDQLARRMDCRPGFFSRLVLLNYLAPDIVTAILDGSHPNGMDSNMLIRANLPMDWKLQRKLLGFPAPRRNLTPRNLFQRGMWPEKPDGIARAD